MYSQGIINTLTALSAGSFAGIFILVFLSERKNLNQAKESDRVDTYRTFPFVARQVQVWRDSCRSSPSIRIAHVDEYGAVGQGQFRMF